MLEHFGADYRLYLARTGRIVPRLDRVLALLRPSADQALRPQEEARHGACLFLG